jgi:hypothetical protein
MDVIYFLKVGVKLCTRRVILEASVNTAFFFALRI